MKIKTKIILITILWLIGFVLTAGAVSGPKVYTATHPVIYNDMYIASDGPTINTRELVLHMVKEAGFNPHIADKVIQCESGWNTKAVGDRGQSWGLWQIHQPAHNTGDLAFDPILSTEYAIKLLNKHGWKPWTCYGILF
jgi:soluble lytic murein transglycosylase-like protein